jgi:hypothetical protein
MAEDRRLEQTPACPVPCPMQRTANGTGLRRASDRDLSRWSPSSRVTPPSPLISRIRSTMSQELAA